MNFWRGLVVGLVRLDGVMLVVVVAAFVVVLLVLRGERFRCGVGRAKGGGMRELGLELELVLMVFRVCRELEASCKFRFTAGMDGVLTSRGACGGGHGGGMSWASRCVEDDCVVHVDVCDARCAELGAGNESAWVWSLSLSALGSPSEVSDSLSWTNTVGGLELCELEYDFTSVSLSSCLVSSLTKPFSGA